MGHGYGVSDMSQILNGSRQSSFGSGLYLLDGKNNHSPRKSFTKKQKDWFIPDKKQNLNSLLPSPPLKNNSLYTSNTEIPTVPIPGTHPKPKPNMKSVKSMSNFYYHKGDGRTLEDLS